jgi:membrane associated rhomboid family serine protease
MLSNGQVYKYLLGANAGIFLLWHVNQQWQNFMVRHFTLSKQGLSHGYFHTLITYGFSHYDFWHFVVNMASLFFFGKAIEAVFGGARLLSLYLYGTLGGAALQLPNSRYSSILLGASSATSAILTFFILNFPQEVIYLYFFPVPAWLFGIGFFGYSFFMMNKQGMNVGVAHSAHIGGILAGVIMYFVSKGKIRRF